jgi:septal ring factor EnvC (AmiA/AmiB activator)
MQRNTYNMTMPSMVRALLVALGLALAPGLAASAPDDPAKAEAELKAVRAQMEKVRAEMGRDAGKRDKLAREIEESEKSVGSARDALEKLRKERAAHNARRAELAEARRVEEAALSHDRAALAGQIRAASMIGREEPLKLLLSQRDPAQADRVLTYYRYFGLARARQIGAINAHLAEIGKLDAAMAVEEQRLLALEQRQKGEVARWSRSRPRRRTARRSSSVSRNSTAASRSSCENYGVRSRRSTASRPTARTRSRSCAASSPGRWLARSRRRSVRCAPAA